MFVWAKVQWTMRLVYGVVFIPWPLNCRLRQNWGAEKNKQQSDLGGQVPVSLDRNFVK